MTNKSKVNWIPLAMVSAITLLLVAHNILPQPKARAQRIQTVNNSPSISFMWTNVALGNSVFPAR
jgi:hypothetical protein